jgi:phosphocarrier protein FPr
MVGLVIVSHSRALAEALVHLVRQVAPPGIPIAVAAGIGDDRQQFGTDAVEISEAIQSVYSKDGALVLMDLGSAILSAEMALELLPPEMAANIRFCPAPLVEGSISASVQIGLGSDLDTVCKEAEQSLLPKARHLESQPPIPAAADVVQSAHPEEEAPGPQIVITLNNQHGLHARPAARFVQTAGRFQAKTQVTNLTTSQGPVSAASLNGLATLGAVKGHQIQITAAGPDAQQALDSLRQLIENNFGEAIEPAPPIPTPIKPSPIPASEPSSFQATPVSDGIALGPLYHYQPAAPPVPQYKAADISQEKLRLEKAIDRTRRDIEQRYQQLKTGVGEEHAAIFEAHLLILQDPDLLERVKQRIETYQENAAVAWSAVINELANTYRNLTNTYQQQRSADVIDIGNQVLFALLGQPPPTPVAFREPVILFAREITPTETAQLDMSHVLGILTTNGGPTSHSAILARALGIPSITGIPPSFNIKPGTLLAINGFTGKIQVDPSPELQQELRVLRQEWIDRQQQLINTSQQPAVTRDGHRVEVYANVGNLMDARSAVQNGAEGIGLLRTEFLFLTRETPPDEAEQLSALREIFGVMGDRPVTIRTLDVGGDKNLPYIHLAEEDNPFLGVRAIRMSLSQPDLFLTQLRAILRAGDRYKVRIMFPMIALLDEVRQAHAWLEKAHQALLAESMPHAWPVETGIMVEVPSTALLSQAFAQEVSFFSIGTNDLTQYTLAAERGNPLLSGLSDAMHPAVLRLIHEVTAAAHAKGKWVSVCGELAGDAEATAVLVGLGVDELSLNPAGIPLIKTILRQINTAQAVALAEKVLQATRAADARHLVQEFMKKMAPVEPL